jgi:hypothetical protein
MDTDILSVDTIYYPGVLEAIKENLREGNSNSAHLIFNAYTNKNGRYPLDFGEGCFFIKDG